MKITTRSEYGLMAMYYLKENYVKRPVAIAQMVADLGLSQTYLEQLFRLLKNVGIVESFRGKEGGYKLAKDPSEISVGQIIRALDGDIELSSKCKDGGHTCSQVECVTKGVFMKIDMVVGKLIDNLYLSDI